MRERRGRPAAAAGPPADGSGTDSDAERRRPIDVERLTDTALAESLPERSPRAHKGTHGTVVVVAGSLDYSGAALLATAATLRAGAGLACLAVPASLQAHFSGRVVEAITVGLPEADDGVDTGGSVSRLAMRPHDALVIGPGSPDGDATRRLVSALIAKPGPPAVLDAGALTALAASGDWWTRDLRPCVLTPHPGEFRRLRPGVELSDDDDARAAACADAADAWGHVVVLKGAHTVIAAPGGRVSRAPFENPALATAGTGDVLAGTIGALIAQGCGPYDAARLGVYLHGSAGEAVAERIGDAGLVASDLLPELPVARKRLAALRRDATGPRLGFTPPAVRR